MVCGRAPPASEQRALDLSAGVLVPLGLALYMGYFGCCAPTRSTFRTCRSTGTAISRRHGFQLINAFGKVAHGSGATLVANQSLEIAFTLLMIGVLVAGWHSLRPSYIAYMALSILVPMSTSNLMSMPRFALVLFPMFAILARWGERPWVNNVILAFSLPLLGLFTVLFADWYWVA